MAPYDVNSCHVFLLGKQIYAYAINCKKSRYLCIGGHNLVMIAGQPRLLEDEYQELDDVARDEEPGPLTDALTTAFGGDLQV